LGYDFEIQNVEHVLASLQDGREAGTDRILLVLEVVIYTRFIRFAIYIHEFGRNFGPVAGIHLLLIQKSEMIFPSLLLIRCCNLAHTIFEWSSDIITVVLHLFFHGHLKEFSVHLQDFVHVLSWNTVVHNLKQNPPKPSSPTHHHQEISSLTLESSSDDLGLMPCGKGTI
jgi:hypothetical protein